MYDRKSTNIYPALGGMHLHASACICTHLHDKHSAAYARMHKQLSKLHTFRHSDTSRRAYKEQCVFTHTGKLRTEESAYGISMYL